MEIFVFSFEAIRWHTTEVSNRVNASLLSRLNLPGPLLASGSPAGIKHIAHSNPKVSYFDHSVDPDQLASEEAS